MPSVLARQVSTLGSPGDLLLLLDIDGEHEAALSAVQAAHAKDMAVIALLGRTGGALRAALGETDARDHRAARSQRARAGDASADPALPVRRDRPSIVGRTGSCMTARAPSKQSRDRAPLAWLVAVLAAAQLSACAPLVVGGAMVGGTMVAIDRRTTGAQVEDQTIEMQGQQPHPRAGRRSFARQRHELQPHGAAHRRGGHRSRSRGDRAGRAAHRERALHGQRAGRDAAQFDVHALERLVPDRQGQGHLRRREGPAGQRLQGGHRARQRLPDGPRHRTRGDAGHRPGAHRQRRAEGGARVRDRHRGRAGRRADEDRACDQERPERSSRLPPAVSAAA